MAAKKVEPFQESIDGLSTWLSSLGFSVKKLNKSTRCGEKTLKGVNAALSQYISDNSLEGSDSEDFNEIIQQL